MAGWSAVVALRLQVDGQWVGSQKTTQNGNNKKKTWGKRKEGLAAFVRLGKRGREGKGRGGEEEEDKLGLQTLPFTGAHMATHRFSKSPSSLAIKEGLQEYL